MKHSETRNLNMGYFFAPVHGGNSTTMILSNFSREKGVFFYVVDVSKRLNFSVRLTIFCLFNLHFRPPKVFNRRSLVFSKNLGGEYTSARCGDKKWCFLLQQTTRQTIRVPFHLSRHFLPNGTRNFTTTKREEILLLWCI